ncbi:MAG: 2-phosphosulfolactate phosphatase [Pirellulaceae bacterium]|nr:2-phosphosulfolactate phosphatase [Pirellulaceae bacterium]
MNRLPVSVAMLPTLLVPPDPALRCGSVVVDTLRFTTTAVQALSAGARSILAVQSIPDARQLADSSGHPRPLLCGERDCRPIPGFQLGNSPLEFKTHTVRSQHLIFSTTNGTKAILSTAQFSNCYLAAFVNRSAMARLMSQASMDCWHLICSGTDGLIAGEDLLAAGAILEQLERVMGQGSLALDDSAVIAMDAWQQAISRGTALSTELERFVGAQNLIRAGFGEDVAFAGQVDLCEVVPVRRSIDGLLISKFEPDANYN